MKTFIVLVLAVIATQAAVIEPPGAIKPHAPNAVEMKFVEPKAGLNGTAQSRSGTTGNEIDIGSIGVGDSLLHRSFPSRRSGQSRHTEEVTYRGGLFTRITCVRVTEMFRHDGATVQIISGGLNQNRVTILIEAPRNAGYNYRFEVWG